MSLSPCVLLFGQLIGSPASCTPLALRKKGFFVSVRTSTNDWKTNAVSERYKRFFHEIYESRPACEIFTIRLITRRRNPRYWLIPYILAVTLYNIDVKNVFTLFILVTFFTFLTSFLFSKRFLFKKTLAKFRAASRLTRSTFKITASLNE